MATVLIQPKRLNFDNYIKVVQENEFGYEILELAKPEVMNDTFLYLKVENFYKEALSEFNGKITFHGAFIDLRVDSPDRLIQIASEKRVRRSIESAIKLNSRRVIFHSGYNPIIKNQYYKNNFVEKSIEFWTKMIDEYDVEIALENMWDESPKVLEKIMSSIPNNRLSVCFDIGHFNVFSKVSLGNWIKTLASYIKQLHFNDNLGNFDSHLRLGSGTIDWNNASEYFEVFTREADVTIEIPDIDDLKDSISYIKKDQIYPYNKSKYFSIDKVF
ncbi:MAG: sugar phosphate isomerase/epimerase family protein [Halanaerobiales bacterium]